YDKEFILSLLDCALPGCVFKLCRLHTVVIVSRSSLVLLTTEDITDDPFQIDQIGAQGYECPLEPGSFVDPGNSAGVSRKEAACLFDSPDHCLSTRNKRKGAARQENQQCAYVRSRHFSRVGAAGSHRRTTGFFRGPTGPGDGEPHSNRKAHA